jgi:hypothetical protein
MSPVSIRKACMSTLLRLSKGRPEIFNVWGCSATDDPYLTMSNAYEAETARLFGRFVGRGYVYKGARPVYWCIHDQTALAEARSSTRSTPARRSMSSFRCPRIRCVSSKRGLRSADCGIGIERIHRKRGSISDPHSQSAIGKPAFVLI